MYDVIIIGAGCAGMGAGMFCAQNKIKGLVLDCGVPIYRLPSELPINGHATKTSGLANDIFDGAALSKCFNEALANPEQLLEFQKNQQVINLEKNVISFSVEVKSGKIYYGKTIIIAVGGAETNFDLLTHKDVSGKIKVDSVMATNVPGIFAAGDVVVSSSGDILVSTAQGAQAALSVLKFLNVNRR